jgi:hypothetical protein
MKTENIEIEGKKYRVKIGFGAMMNFEEATGKSITEIDGKNDILKLAYSTLQYNNEDFKYSFKEFVDNILDENPQLFIDLIKLITSLIFDKTEEVVEDKKK